MNLQDKVAYINGGARIGGVVAETLAQEGCDVVLSYRVSSKKAQKTAEMVRKMGRRALVVRGDLTRGNQVKAILRKIVRQFGKLDILVNMASLYEKTPWSKLSQDKWSKILDSNLKSTFLVVQTASPYLKKARGRVVNFSDWVSASGRPRYKDFVPSYTAKSGIIGLTQAQALELAPQVLVNAIAPGPILPPKKMTNEEKRKIREVTPLRRWGGGPRKLPRRSSFCARQILSPGNASGLMEEGIFFKNLIKTYYQYKLFY